jgi:dihydrofolate synthase/folylpolyglutamate synthase
MSTKPLTPIESRLAAASSPAILPGLERIHSLLRLLGRPERGLRAVHVAGSNGKGSVCRLMESALAAQGLRTGLFISPHLVDFTERYRLNTRPAPRKDLEAAAKPLWAALRAQSTRPEGPATYFEALTALAFLYFRRQKVDVLLLETGLGGRLDSTNVLPHPLLTVITNISLEHTQILGKTEALIAAEKAGIIKKGSPLVTAAKGRARAVILRRFRQVQGGSKARLIALQKDQDWQVLSWHDSAEHQSQTLVLRHLGDKHVLALPLLGRHQHENLACALAGLKLLTPKLGLDWGRLAYGLSRADWPGRLQVIGRRPLTLLDGAHNPAGARVLADYVAYLASQRGPSRRAWVLGVLKDKDWKSMFRTWAPLADRIFVARPPDARGLAAGEAVKWLRLQGISAQAAPDLEAALKRARSWTGPRGLVVAAGSLYSAGALLKKA